MKVNGISVAQNNTSFRSVYNSSIPVQRCSCKKDDAILKTGLVALGILSAASILYGIARKNNMNVVQFVKSSYNNAKSFITDKREPDFLTILLKDKRDTEAVKMYKGYKAKDKMDSLHKKLLAGDFDGKSKEVFNCLRRNEIKLRREASFVG